MAAELEQLQARNDRLRERNQRFAEEIATRVQADVDVFGLAERARPAGGDRREEDDYVPFLGVAEVARRGLNPASPVARRARLGPRFNPNP